MKKLALTSLSIFLLLFYSFSQNCSVNEHAGEATYYDFEEAGGFGNCSFDDTKIRPFLIGAMNELDYNQADYCGSCVEVQGPNGTVTVQIIDRCPECKTGDIDLSPEAFDYIAPRIDGRVEISWHLVPCPVKNNLRFVFKTGSSQWWAAIQVLNHRNKIESLEIKQNGKYVELPRQKYNYFLAEDGLGKGPFDFRITDVFGHVVEEKNIPLQLGKELLGDHQFPECVVLSNQSYNGLKKTYYHQGSIYFANSVGSYNIYDLTGKLVQKGNHIGKVDVSFSSGIYLLKQENGSVVKLLVP